MGRRGRPRKIHYNLHGNFERTPLGMTREIIHGNFEREGHGPVEVHSNIETTPSTWTTGEKADDKCAKDCSWAEKQPKSSCHLFMTRKVGNAVSYLLQNVPIEWQILLIGRPETRDDKELVMVDDYYIAKQEVGPAHVHNLDCIDKAFIAEKGIIGTMHSHVDMGAFFSPTDMESCNSSPLKYHVVINKKYQYEAVKQVPVPCGMFRFEKITISFAQEILEKPVGFENIIQAPYSGQATYESSSWSVPEKRVIIHDKRRNDIQRGVHHEFWD